MGLILDILRGRSTGALNPSPMPLSNVWDTGPSLARFVLPSEVIKALPAALNRDEAESISAVNRGRNQLVTAIAPLPLVALKADGTPAVQPTFLYRTDSGSTVYDRMARTVDSLVFHGAALWAVKRGADGSILDAVWVPHDRWKFDAAGRVLVDGRPVDERDVILFTHISRGLLNVATTTLRAAADIAKAVARNAKNPVPLAAFEHTDSNPVQLEDEEIAELLRQWREARESPDGAIGYVPPGLKLSTPSQPIDAGLLTEARNASRLDVADFLNIPVEMLGGSASQGSLTYVTQEGSRHRFDAEALPFWCDPIAYRLSQDEVVPHGQRVRFDLTERQAVAQTPTGAPSDD